MFKRLFWFSDFEENEMREKADIFLSVPFFLSFFLLLDQIHRVSAQLHRL